MIHSLQDFVDLTAEQREIVRIFEHDPLLCHTFYLTGGTLLKVLGVVPRISNDLDFFTFPSIESRVFMTQMKRVYTLLADVFGTKSIATTDKGFIHQPSGMIIDLVADGIGNIDDFVSFGNLLTAGLKDCAAGKASALCSRDEIKDYIDIAFLTKQEGWTLKDLEEFAEKKFGLGTITEEKLLTELLEKRASFTIPSHIFLRNPEENRSVVEYQISDLIEHVTI